MGIVIVRLAILKIQAKPVNLATRVAILVGEQTIITV